MNMKQNFSIRRNVIQTIDPVHIGTGGMHLGRVDNSIVRETGTKLPKIPGTSLSGAIRSYSAYIYGKRCCAGQKGQCGCPTCPICYTFGSISGDTSYSGVVSIGDARILLFPVYSMAGPVWVTSQSTLEDFGTKDQTVSEDKAKMASALDAYRHLNLGWLILEKEDSLMPNGLPSKLPNTVKERIVLVSDKIFSHVVNSNLEVRTSVSINPETGAAEGGALFNYEAIPRATFLWLDVVVDDYREMFPSYNFLEKIEQILSNATPSSKDAFDILRNIGLLRKYNEDVLTKKNSEYEKDFQNAKDKLLKWIGEEKPYYEKETLSGKIKWKRGATTDTSFEDTPYDVVTAGLALAEHLGIGGMGTRGFGRIRIIDNYEVES